MLAVIFKKLKESQGSLSIKANNTVQSFEYFIHFKMKY